MKIVYTGLRPGEKLYEEMLMEEEGLQCTENESIHIGKRLEMNEMQFFQDLKRLDKACHTEQSDIGAIVADIVPTYSYEKHMEPVFIPSGSRTATSPWRRR
jgi:FlaA1/EpsC-like NDP-sugar epimerase